MSSRIYTREELEKLFTKWYKGKIISWNYPGLDTIHGMCNEVAFNGDSGGELTLHINDKQYICSLEMIHEIVKVVRS